MARDENSKQFSTACIAGAVILAAVTVYWQAMPLLYHSGVDLSSLATVNKNLLLFKDILKDTYTIRGLILVFIFASAMMKTGKKTDESVAKGAVWSIVGTALVMLPTQNHWIYLFTLASGIIACTYGYSIFFRQLKGGKQPDEDSFMQCDDLIETNYSVNIPYHYTYQKKRHDAWINLVAPFRASMVMGVPGSGKSFAIYNKCRSHC